MNSIVYCINFQYDHPQREAKTWFELGEEMGIVVVSSEDEVAEELTEEEKEVERLLNKGLETKRKAIKGMSNLSDGLINLMYLLCTVC